MWLGEGAGPREGNGGGRRRVGRRGTETWTRRQDEGERESKESRGMRKCSFVGVAELEEGSLLRQRQEWARAGNAAAKRKEQWQVSRIDKAMLELATKLTTE